MLQEASDSFVSNWFNPPGFNENHLRIPYRFKADNYSPSDKQKIRDALNDLSTELDQCIEFYDDTECWALKYFFLNLDRKRILLLDSKLLKVLEPFKTALYGTKYIQIRNINEYGGPAVPNCSSYVGFIGARTYQTLQLKPSGSLDPSTVQHEMIHALGKELNFTISLPVK